MSEDLGALRGRIDEIDRQMVRLFEKRMQAAKGVAAYKIDHHMPVLDASREEAVLASRADMLEDPALSGELTALYRHIMAISRAEQQEILLARGAQAAAYSGVPGAYAEEALIDYFGEAAERLQCRGFAEVFEAVAAGRARYGVVPLENSSAGSVFDVYDLLGRCNLRIVGEQMVHVRHCLLGLPGHSVGIRHICHRLHGPFEFRQRHEHGTLCRFKATGQLACQPCGQPLLLFFGHFVLHRPQTVLRLEQLVQ